MDLEDLRIIVLDERESGKLCEVHPDTFEKARNNLAELYQEARSIDYFLTERAGELINEIESIKATLNEIIFERSKKILKLAMNQTGKGYDKGEMKKMLPEEQEMFEEISRAIGTCRTALTDPGITESSQGALISPETIHEVISEPFSEPFSANAEISADTDDPAYTLVHILKDMESFMGVDGKIYTLKSEDLVTLPEQNAIVLYEHNIALNIRVGK